MAITIDISSIAKSADGIRYSAYRAGDAPVGGGSTITGSGFGTNTATQHLSSDLFKDEAIGAATELGNWSWGPYNVDIANDATRGKVLKGSTDGTNINNTRIYDYGSSIAAGTPVFASWLTKFETDADGVTDFQWKMFRLEETSNFVDDGPELAQFNWFGGNGKQFIIRPQDGLTNAVSRYGAPYPDKNEWSRQELIIDTGTQGGSDTDFYLSKYPLGSTPSYNSYLNELALNDAARWRYFVWQNYIGNVSGGTINQRDHLGDDYYIQVGSLKRVILSDTLDPTLATFTQIQKWTTWSDSEVIIDPNLNSVADGSYYLLVMDAASTVLGSKAVTVSGGALA